MSEEKRSFQDLPIYYVVNCPLKTEERGEDTDCWTDIESECAVCPHHGERITLGATDEFGCAYEAEVTE